jgi:hypothetical protein
MTIGSLALPSKKNLLSSASKNCLFVTNQLRVVALFSSVPSNFDYFPFEKKPV